MEAAIGRDDELRPGIRKTVHVLAFLLPPISREAVLPSSIMAPFSVAIPVNDANREV